MEYVSEIYSSVKSLLGIMYVEKQIKQANKIQPGPFDLMLQIRLLLGDLTLDETFDKETSILVGFSNLFLKLEREYRRSCLRIFVTSGNTVIILAFLFPTLGKKIIKVMEGIICKITPYFRLILYT